MKTTILAVGDILFGEIPLLYNCGVKTIIQKKGIDYVFRDVAKFFTEDKIIFGNLEAPISVSSDNTGFSDYFFRAEPKVVNGLRNAHFSALSVANNHMMEHGDDAFHSTIRYLQSSNIIPVGIRGTIQTFTAQDTRFAFLGYSFIDDFKADHLYNKVDSETKIIEDIEKIRDEVDFIVVSLHWGEEYVKTPSPMQVRVGRKLVDHGADLILGTHPHVIQGYEKYKDKIIIYSFGNFIIDNYTDITRDSFIAEIHFDNTAHSLSIDVIPVMAHSKEHYPTIPGNPEEIMSQIEEVKRRLEGKSIMEYSQKIGNYGDLVLRSKKKAKRKMIEFFITHIYNYPPVLTGKIVLGFFSRIWRGRNETPYHIRSFR